MLPKKKYLEPIKEQLHGEYQCPRCLELSGLGDHTGQLSIFSGKLPWPGVVVGGAGNDSIHNELFGRSVLF